MGGIDESVSIAEFHHVLRVHASPVAARQDPASLEVPEDRREAWAERVAIMVTDGVLTQAAVRPVTPSPMTTTRGAGLAVVI